MYTVFLFMPNMVSAIELARRNVATTMDTHASNSPRPTNNMRYDCVGHAAYDTDSRQLTGNSGYNRLKLMGKVI